MKVSLCTACKGRKHHVVLTLPENIRDSMGCEDIEFVLLDYSSPDKLARWVRRRMMPHIESGRLVYLRRDGEKYFRFSHARNLMFKMATGDIVCNVDADIIVKRGYARWLQEHFTASRRTLVSPGGDKTGRGIGWLALLKSNFLKLGGYDERFDDGWGFEDNDLVRRARGLGIPRVAPPRRFGQRIHHGRAESTRFVRGHLDCVESGRTHRRLSATSMKKKRYTANRGRAWGAGLVTVNFGEELEIK